MTQLTALDTCRIVWWAGYVRGRFVAIVDGDPPLLAGESPSFRQRQPPDRTAESVDAVEALVERLHAQGWDDEDDESGEWYERRFTRPAARPELAAADVESAASRSEALDARILDELRSDLSEARAAAERERRARLRAEAAAVPPAEPHLILVSDSEPARRSLLALAVYAVAVVAAAAVFLVGFQSWYAAAVAALAVAAVCVAVDCLRVAR